MAERKICISCKQNRQLKEFTKDRPVCNDCFAGKERIQRECGNNAYISKLLRWPVPPTSSSVNYRRKK